jgi:hypothetical protein
MQNKNIDTLDIDEQVLKDAVSKEIVNFPTDGFFLKDSVCYIKQSDVFSMVWLGLQAAIKYLKPYLQKRESLALTHEQVKAQGFCTPGFPCNYCMGLLKPANRTEGQL